MTTVKGYEIEPGADLRSANLSGANLSYGILSGADLRYVNLRVADLHDARLHEANLHNADLRGASLSGANLSLANLSGANLYVADLRGASLIYADLSDTKLPHYLICPEEGSFIGWKRVRDNVIKLLIPEDAKRTSSLISRKCRASFVKVIGGLPEGERVTSALGGVYELNKTVKPNSFNDDIRLDCTNGIHFFMTRKEAEEWPNRC